MFRFHIDATGRERLPRGGYLLIGAAHRGWMDPFVVMHALPEQPRCWFLGSGPSTFTSRWRETLIHRLGGLLPVWRGGIGVESHVEAARAVIRNGGVFVQMPEGTVSGSAGRIGPFRIGARTDRPAHRRSDRAAGDRRHPRSCTSAVPMASQILPPTSLRELLGDAWDGTLPPEGSREELALARRLTERFEALLGPEVEALYPATIDPPGAPAPAPPSSWQLGSCSDPAAWTGTRAGETPTPA